MHGPQLLPGGEWVVFTFLPAGSPRWDEALIVVQSLASGERETLISGGRNARYVSTGHLVYGLNGVILAVPFDVGDRQVVGGPVSLVDGVMATTTTPASGATQFALADTGSLVYVPGGLSRSVMPRSSGWIGRAVRNHSAPPREATTRRRPRRFPGRSACRGRRCPARSFRPAQRSYTYPRISPDGTRVVVGARDQDADLWIWDLARETQTRFTFDSEGDFYPVWTPDSERIAFRSRREGGRNIFWKAADGSGTVERLTDSPSLQIPYAFSPDGTRLVFREGLRDPDLVVLSMEGDRPAEPLLTTEFDERNAALSPDGRWVAYQSNASGENEIYVRSFPDVEQGGLAQISTSGGVQPVWGPDGQELFYRSDAGLMVVPVGTEPSFTAGNPEVVVEDRYFPGEGGRDYDITPDGERFLFVTQGAEQVGEDQSGPQLIFVDNWFQELTERVPVP